MGCTGSWERSKLYLYEAFIIICKQCYVNESSPHDAAFQIILFVDYLSLAPNVADDLVSIDGGIILSTLFDLSARYRYSSSCNRVRTEKCSTVGRFAARLKKQSKQSEGLPPPIPQPPFHIHDLSFPKISLGSTVLDHRIWSNLKSF